MKHLIAPAQFVVFKLQELKKQEAQEMSLVERHLILFYFAMEKSIQLSSIFYHYALTSNNTKTGRVLKMHLARRG